MGQFEPSLLATDAAERTRFLAALKSTGTIRAAAQATGHNRTTVLRLRRRDEAFDKACAAALGTAGAATAALEAAMLARATHGFDRTRIVAGKAVTWREFDNKLAMFMLAKLKPETFGDVAATTAAPPPAMTRAEFIAAIGMRPKTIDLPE